MEVKEINIEIRNITKRLYKWRKFLAPEALDSNSYTESSLYLGFCIYSVDILKIQNNPLVYPRGVDFLKLINGTQLDRFVFPTKSLRDLFEEVCEEDLKKLRVLYNELIFQSR